MCADRKVRVAGVDVGGDRKGFHVAVLDGTRLVALDRVHGATAADDERERAAAGVVERIAGADLVAVDAPREPAPDGEASRPAERAFVAAGITSLRYTPDERRLDASPDHYRWVRNGFGLYAALVGAGLDAIEVFPTAAWTIWVGERGDRPRAAWTSAGLGILTHRGLRGVPAATNLDERDAIAAAWTARLHLLGRTRSFGPLVVPS